MKRKINIALIGTGRIGSMHARNLAFNIPEVNLVALCDIRLDVAHAVAAEVGVERVVYDYRELLADPDIEAVHVSTTTSTHAMIVQDAARAGKQIFCEKPLALDLKDIDETMTAVNQAGVKLQLGFNRRFDRSFKKVREIVHSGEIGRPCVLRITSRDPEPPSLDYALHSGGMFLDHSIHDFDMARFQVGEVSEVYAVGGVLVAPELAKANDVDTNIITLKFENGAMGSIDNSRQAVYGYDQRLEVFCSEGMAEALNETVDTAVTANRTGYHRGPLPRFFIQRYAPCYVEEVRQFANCVIDDQPVPVGGDDGRKAVVLGMAAWKSLRENRPVRVSEIEENLDIA